MCRKSRAEDSGHSPVGLLLSGTDPATGGEAGSV